MKNTLKRIAMLTLVCVLALSAVLPVLAEGSAVDYSLFPENFAEWTLADMKTYLKKCDLITNESYLLLDLSEGDLSAMKADCGTMYLDYETGSVYDMIIFFDTAKPESAEMLASIIEYHAIVINGDVENGVDMDCVLGSFCFSYLLGYNDDHIDAFIGALKTLAEHYGIEPAYING